MSTAKGFLTTSLLCLLTLGMVFIGKIHAEAPMIVITEPLIGTTFPIQSDVTLKGMASPNSDITLSTQDGDYAKLRSDGDGNWSYTIPTVSEGSHTIRATVTVTVDSLSAQSAGANVTYNVGNTSTMPITRLAETGAVLVFAIPAGLLLCGATLYTYLDYRKHKRPLKAADPRVKYSFWHHLHVVSFPVIRYRLSINIDKRLPSKSDKIRRY